MVVDAGLLSLQTFCPLILLAEDNCLPQEHGRTSRFLEAVLYVFPGNKGYQLQSRTANLHANFSEQLAFIVVNNRTLNVSGCAGKGKPVDMSIEHHNLILKNALRSSGENVTQEHLTTITLASQQDDAAVLCDNEFHTPVNCGHHSQTECKSDVNCMTELLLQSNVTKEVHGRQLPNNQPFDPSIGVGYNIAIGKQWIQKFLKKTESIVDFEYNDTEDHISIESIEDIPL